MLKNQKKNKKLNSWNYHIESKVQQIPLDDFLALPGAYIIFQSKLSKKGGTTGYTQNLKKAVFAKCFDRTSNKIYFDETEKLKT